MRSGFLCVASVLLATSSSVIPLQQAASAQQPAYPIEARLVTSLDAHTLKAGDEILFTSTHQWQDGDCQLAQGATLHARVVSAAFGHGVKHENIALAFTYPCPEVGTFPIHWIALLAPDPDLMKGVHDNPGNVRALRSESFGEGMNASSTSSQVSKNPSGRGNPSVPLFSDDGQIDPVVKRPVQVHSGDVWQIPRIKLQVASGPRQSSIVSSTSGRLRLVTGSIFVLSVGQAVAAATASSSAAPPPSVPPQQKQNHVIPELARCVAPACSLHPSAAGEAHVAWTISVKDVGYRQQIKAEMPGLDYGAAIAFLGPDQLLIVFDPHRLVDRDILDRPEDHAHMMRAVLFDLSTRRVVKTLDWRVSDQRKVLWQAGDGGVILHQGNSLHWYGPGLIEQRELPLSGPLAFFRASPDGQHFAVGTFLELHNAAEHQRLLDANANGPEETVEVRLLDGNLKQIFRGQQSSRALAPVLLNNGSIDLRIFKGDQFYLRQRTWNGANFTSFARLVSGCIPRLSGLLTNMLVVESCPVTKVEHRISVLRADGTPVLDMSTPLEQFPPLAVSGSDLFALSLLQGGNDYRRDGVFKAESLAAEKVNIYRASDGRLLASQKFAHPLASHQPTAISPDGTTLAVLDGQQIRGFNLAGASRLAQFKQTPASQGQQ